MKIKLGVCQELSIFDVLPPPFGLQNRAVGTGLPDSFLHVIYGVSEYLSAQVESQFITLSHHLTPDVMSMKASQNHSIKIGNVFVKIVLIVFHVWNTDA